MRSKDVSPRWSFLTGSLLFAAMLTLASPLVEAQEPAPPSPPAATQDPPQAAPASEREIESDFTEGLKALDEFYFVRWKALQEERRDGFQRLLDDATAKKDANAVVELREKIAAIETEIKEASDALKSGAKSDAGAAALAKALRGTVWQWGPDETIRLDEDGQVTCVNWNNRGLRTSWRAIDRRTVLLYIVEGRNENRYAILKFDPGVQYFTLFPFEGSPYNPKNRTERVKRRS
ncbi:MAG TPA: hypothetical protein VGE52_00910 [Pirellulales bacterium]